MTNNENSSTQNIEYEVEDIIDFRKRKEKNLKTNKIDYKKEYLVKWVGYIEPSWEPEENLDNCQEILNDFKQRMKNKKKRKEKKYSHRRTNWTYGIYFKNNNKSEHNNLKENKSSRKVEKMNNSNAFKSCYKMVKYKKVYEIDINCNFHFLI